MEVLSVENTVAETFEGENTQKLISLFVPISKSIMCECLGVWWTILA